MKLIIIPPNSGLDTFFGCRMSSRLVQLSTSQSLVPKQGIRQPGRRSPKPGSGWLWFSLPTAVNQSKTKQNVLPSSMPKYRRWQQHPANTFELSWSREKRVVYKYAYSHSVTGLQMYLRKRCRKVFSEGQWILLHPELLTWQPGMICFGSIPVYVWVMFSPLLLWKNKQTKPSKPTHLCCLIFVIFCTEPPKQRLLFAQIASQCPWHFCGADQLTLVT